MTPQRQIIIDLLSESDTQLDAEALYQRAKERDSSISIATVYRTLNVLESAGLVQPHFHTREHERKYYDRNDEVLKPSYHFTCRVCKQVIPVKSEVMEDLRNRLAAELNLDVSGVCVCLEGLCPICRAAEAADEDREQFLQEKAAG